MHEHFFIIVRMNLMRQKIECTFFLINQTDDFVYKSSHVPPSQRVYGIQGIEKARYVSLDTPVLGLFFSSSLILQSSKF